MLTSWTQRLSLWCLWLSVGLSTVGGPAGVTGQNPPTPMAPTPMPPSPQAPSTMAPSPQPPSTMAPTTTRAPSPLTPTARPPSTMAPTTVSPSPLPPTPQTPSTMAPTTTTTTTTTARPPPPPHPEDDTRFYLIEVRIPASDSSLSHLSSGDYVSKRVKDVVSLFLSVTSRKYSGLWIVQLYKVVGESVLLAVVKADSRGAAHGVSSLHKLEDKLSGLGIDNSVIPLTSFEAFARALGAGVAATQNSASSSSSLLHTSERIHCYALEYIPGAASSAQASINQLRQIVSFILQERREGLKLDAYKVLAKTNVEFFICANTVLSEFDRMFLDLWTATNQPAVTSVKFVREVQSVDMYLHPGKGTAGNGCSGFWCSFW